MNIEAISQSIQDETDERMENATPSACLDRIRELKGMLEILQLIDETPAILAGSIMAMAEKLAEQYRSGQLNVPHVHY